MAHKIALTIQGGTRWLGGFYYVSNLARAVKNTGLAEVFAIIPEGFNDAILPELRSVVDRVLTTPSPGLPFTERLRRKSRAWLGLKTPFPSPLNSLVREHQLDFVYPYYPYALEQSEFYYASWIPDFQHLHLPQNFTSAQIAERNRDFQYFAQVAPKVALSSEMARRDFATHFAPHLSKVTVLPFHSIAENADLLPAIEEVVSKYHLPDRFFLFPSQFWQHKNHLMVLEMLAHLRKQAIRPVIVCTGLVHDTRRIDFGSSVLRCIHEYGVADQVYVLGVIPRLEMIQLLRKSLAVLLPSAWEGWSTVVEDARAYGKNLILSDHPVHLEQNVPAARYFALAQPETLAEALRSGWESLTPGPHLTEEARAQANSLTLVRGMAEKFLALSKRP